MPNFYILTTINLFCTKLTNHGPKEHMSKCWSWDVLFLATQHRVAQKQPWHPTNVFESSLLSVILQESWDIYLSSAFFMHWPLTVHRPFCFEHRGPSYILSSKHIQSACPPPTHLHTHFYKMRVNAVLTNKLDVSSTKPQVNNP